MTSTGKKLFQFTNRKRTPTAKLPLLPADDAVNKDDEYEWLFYNKAVERGCCPRLMESNNYSSRTVFELDTNLYQMKLVEMKKQAFPKLKVWWNAFGRLEELTKTERSLRDVVLLVRDWEGNNVSIATYKVMYHKDNDITAHPKPGSNPIPLGKLVRCSAFASEMSPATSAPVYAWRHFMSNPRDFYKELEIQPPRRCIGPTDSTDEEMADDEIEPKKRYTPSLHHPHVPEKPPAAPKMNNWVLNNSDDRVSSSLFSHVRHPKLAKKSRSNRESEGFPFGVVNEEEKIQKKKEVKAEDVK